MVVEKRKTDEKLLLRLLSNSGGHFTTVKSYSARRHHGFYISSSLSLIHLKYSPEDV